MSEPFIAEIKIFAGNFAPRDYAFCDGQLLPIAQNTALFSLVGTTYGGDGRTTFGLPNLQGRAPMHLGTGPGLPTRRLGERGGSEQAFLTEGQMPPHTHPVNATDFAGTVSNPAGNVFARSVGGNAYGLPVDLVPLADAALPPTGGSQPHNNMQPFLTLNFIIALFGIFPTRNYVA